MQVNKISATNFGNLAKGRVYPAPEKRERTYSYNNDLSKPTSKEEMYIDKRLKEQDANFKKAIEKQNALIGSSLIAMVNYLNGNSDANTTRELIQNKLIKKAEQKRIEI